MPTIYEHQIPERRMLNFANKRQKEIDEQISQLKLERELMQMILDKFDPDVCSVCKGEQTVMRLRSGDDAMDGLRMHKCEICNGTGKK